MTKKETERIDFDVIREDFNIYRVDNGQILKIKKVLADIVNETDDNGVKKGGLAFSDFSHVITPVEIDTSSLEHAPIDKVSESDQIREMEFTSLKETINIYETKRDLILVATRLDKVFLTNKKDQRNGAPILRYNSSAGISVIEKTSLNVPPPVENDSLPADTKLQK